MAASKYIAQVLGRLKEITATVMSAGAADDGKIVALDSTGKLHVSLLPAGIGADVTLVAAFENVSAGDFLSIFNDTGTAKARKADASTEGKEAIGYTLSAVTAGQMVTVYHEGSNNGLTGLVPGTRYYLSDSTPGGFTATPVTGTGKVSQYLGTASSTTALVFEATDGIVLA